MRRRGLSLVFSLAFAALIALPAAARTRVSLSFFYSELSPWGEWVELGGYGPCWHPVDVAYGWQPYLDGEWVYTDYGWTWVSFDPWGGDPYHFGTWIDDVDFGWCWIPGTVWAPAWVTWYIGDDYCGWAPVPPSLAVAGYGYAGPPVRDPPASYVFVPTSRFSGVDASQVRAAPSRNAELVRRAAPVTRFAVTRGVVTTAGPARMLVSRAEGRTIHPVSVVAAHTAPVPVAKAVTRGAPVRVIAPAPARHQAFRSVAPAAHGSGRVLAPPRAIAPPRGAVPAPRVARPAPVPRRLPSAGRVAPPPMRSAPRPMRAVPHPRVAPPARMAPPPRPMARMAPPPPRRVAPPRPLVERERPQ